MLIGAAGKYGRNLAGEVTHAITPWRLVTAVTVGPGNARVAITEGRVGANRGGRLEACWRHALLPANALFMVLCAAVALSPPK